MACYGGVKKQRKQGRDVSHLGILQQRLSNKVALSFLDLDSFIEELKVEMNARN